MKTVVQYEGTVIALRLERIYTPSAVYDNPHPEADIEFDAQQGKPYPLRLQTRVPNDGTLHLGQRARMTIEVAE